MSAGISNSVYHGNVFVSLDCTSQEACCFQRSRSHFLWEKFFSCFKLSFFYLLTSDKGAYFLQSECIFFLTNTLLGM